MKKCPFCLKFSDSGLPGTQQLYVLPSDNIIHNFLLFQTATAQVKTGDNIILVDSENSGEVFTVPQDGYMGSTFKQEVQVDKATTAVINAKLSLESAIRQSQREEGKLDAAVTTASNKVESINDTY